MEEKKTEKNRISGISENNSGREENVKIDLKNGLKKKLPENFNINDIGNIDLREAEKIANEDILFLTENDLIIGLEDFDLIPLKNGASSSIDEPVTPMNGGKSAVKQQKDKDPLITYPPSESRNEKDISITIEEKEQAIIQSILSNGAGEATEVSGETVLEEELSSSPDIFPGNARKEEPGEEEKTEVISDESVEIADDVEFEDIMEFSEPEFSSLSEDDFVEIPATESMKDKVIVPGKKVEELAIAEIKSVDEYTSNQIKEIGLDDSRVKFIDDESFAKGEVPVPVFGESELEKISVDIEEIIEGRPIILTEAENGEDHKMVASFISDDRNAYSDLIIDFEDAEYKYRDTELDIIESSIIGDDYSDYIKKIDDYYDATGVVGTQGTKTSIEIFGLSEYEMGGIEEHLFHEEYKGIDIEAEVDLFKVDFGLIDLSESREKNYRYITSHSEELDETIRASIEEDLSSDNALIFEEDVEEIEKILGREIDDPKKPTTKERNKKRLGETVRKEKSSVDVQVLDETLQSIDEIDDEIVFTDSNLEIIVEDFYDEMASESPPIEAVGSLAESGHEEIYDITDKIVILDDDIDIDRFIKKFPENKQDNLKTLLKYLDGLFEKLPESTIKSFADSEYFDLYTKVLNDMGIS